MSIKTEAKFVCNFCGKIRHDNEEDWFGMRFERIDFCCFEHFIENFRKAYYGSEKTKRN